MVLGEGGHFSPAGIVGSHTLSLLLLSHTAHDRTEGNPHTRVDIDSETNTWAQYKPRQGSMNSVPL